MVTTGGYVYDNYKERYIWGGDFNYVRSESFWNMYIYISNIKNHENVFSIVHPRQNVLPVVEQPMPEWKVAPPMVLAEITRNIPTLYHRMFPQNVVCPWGLIYICNVTKLCIRLGFAEIKTYYHSGLPNYFIALTVNVHSLRRRSITIVSRRKWERQMVLK